MNDVTAVIAAGGHGTRCDSIVPKSLQKIGILTYLEILLIQLVDAGIENAIVYCNRREHASQILSLSQRIMTVRLYEDIGCESTFELAKHSADIVSSSSILFCYGHAPRPAEYLKSMLVQHMMPVISVVKSTSRNSVISYHSNGYIEPPYLLSVSSLLRSCSEDWETYFANEVNNSVGILVDGPCEFNHLGERHVYEKYVESWVS